MQVMEKRRQTSADTLAIWREFNETGDTRVRDRLVMRLTPLVRYIVARKVKNLPVRCDMEDYVSAGLEALIKSLERYRPDAGATLEQFAWTRIHGAMLDELRRADWAPRSVRRWQRDAARAQAQFAIENSRPPTDEELGQALGLTAAEIGARRVDLHRVDVSSLNEMVRAEDSATIELGDTIESGDLDADPERTAEVNLANARLVRAVKQLGDRERKIVLLRYSREMTLREIGDQLGVSESRVCQILSSVTSKLREQLTAESELFLSAVA